MAGPATQASAHVLRKTKLGESDLIITMLAQDGSLIRGVAKGARKPQSTFASRLELSSKVTVLLAQTKGIPIISEVRVIDAHKALRDDVVRSAAAACAAELFGQLAQEELPNQRFSALMDAFLAQLEAVEEAQVPLVLAAELLKALAVSGFSPNVDTCLFCESSVTHETGAFVAYSYAEGGPVCADCRLYADAVTLPAPILAWVSALMYRPFSAIATLDATRDIGIALLQFADAFIQAHLTRLKSLGFFLTTSIPLIFPCETDSAPLQ